MEKMFSIKPFWGGKVRTTLCIEHIEMEHAEVLKEFGMVTVVGLHYGDHSEDFLMFEVPYRIPKFNRFYASKIKSSMDPYLQELLKRLLYLNPRPSEKGKKDICTFVVNTFVATIRKEASDSFNEVDVPLVKHEEVRAVLDTLTRSGLEYEPDSEDVIMFSEKSQLLKADKISFRNKVRADKIKKHMEGMIHNAVEMLIDQEELLKVTSARIENSKLVVTRKGPANVRSIRKFMSPRTKNVIDEHNEVAFFSSTVSLDKFRKYAAMEDVSLNHTAEVLGVSKSTVVSYRQIKEYLDSI